jgi:hypothetical protein
MLSTAYGRFWSMDVWEGSSLSPNSLNKYLYSLGDPIRYNDPSGYSAAAAGGSSLAEISIVTALIATFAVLSTSDILGGLASAADQMISDVQSALTGLVTTATTRTLAIVYALSRGASKALTEAIEGVKTQLKRIRCKGQLLFHYTSVAAAVAISTTGYLLSSSGAGKAFPPGAYASDIWPVDLTFTQRTLSLGFYNHPFHDVSAFVAFCSAKFTVVGHIFPRVRHYWAPAPAGIPVKIDVKFAGPNMMAPF